MCPGWRRAKRRTIRGRNCRTLVRKVLTGIARELHDQFGRYLTTIKMDVRSIERHLAGAMTSEIGRILREKAQTIGQTVEDTVQTVRAIATQLRPGILDRSRARSRHRMADGGFSETLGHFVYSYPARGRPPVSRDQARAPLWP
jgi:signal transduction histidine kinase